MIARDIASQFARSPETLHLSRRGPSQLERLFAGLLADPGDAPKGDEVDGSPDIERKKQDRVKQQHDKSRAESEKGTPVGSPGDEKSAIGPLAPGKSPHDGVQPQDRPREIDDDEVEDDEELSTRERARRAKLRVSHGAGGVGAFARGLQKQFRSIARRSDVVGAR